MLKKSAGLVLASLRGSTYRSVRLASSLATALLDGLFEHPAVIETFALSEVWSPMLYEHTEFFLSLLKHMSYGARDGYFVTKCARRFCW